LDVPFSLRYLDDENDLCTISNQLELDYAVSHSSPLRLKVTKFDSKKSTAVEEVLTTPAPVPVQKASPTPREQFLKEKLIFIQSTLENPDLPPHRVENLNRRKARLESKLEKLQSAPTPSEGVASPPCFEGMGWGWGRWAAAHGGPGGFRGRGCGRRGGAQFSSPGEPASHEVHAHGAPHRGPHHGPHHGPHGGCRGRWNKKNWRSNPQMQEINQEIKALKELLTTKRMALKVAKQNGSSKPELEALFEEFLVARNNLREKKLAKREFKDARLKTQMFETEAEPNCHDPASKTDRPMKCQRANPELAEFQKEIVALRQIVGAKREALQNARTSGAQKSEIEALFEELVTARSNLRSKKISKRNLKDAWFKAQTVDTA